MIQYNNKQYGNLARKSGEGNEVVAISGCEIDVAKYNSDTLCYRNKWNGDHCSEYGYGGKRNHGRQMQAVTVQNNKVKKKI